MPTSNFLNSFLKRVHIDTELDPVRDWLILLTLGAIALAGIIVWNIWAFDTVAGGGIIGTPSARTGASLTDSSLEEIRTVFLNHATEEAKYETGVYRFTDPSQ